MAPILLILLGVVSAAGVAWGCDAGLAAWPNGLSIMRSMHRLQWLLVGLSVVSGASLAGLVTFGRRRAWWLIGLLPVVSIFAWRFGVADERLSLWVDDQPSFVPSTAAGWLGDDELVIGLEIDGQAYAYPVAAMRRTPIVVQSDRARRLLVAWNDGARASSAAWVDRAIRGRDLEIVAAPMGAVLAYNRRVGEFFDGLTLRTPDGRSASGVADRIATTVRGWSAWRTQRPETLVLQSRWTHRNNAAPRALPVEDEVTLLLSNPPAAIGSAQITPEPTNIGAGRVAALVWRDESGRVRAFSRQVDEDLFPRFETTTDRKTRQRLLRDVDSGSTWSFDGVAVDGPLKGTRLREILVQDGVSSASVRFWVKDVFWAQ